MVPELGYSRMLKKYKNMFYGWKMAIAGLGIGFYQDGTGHYGFTVFFDQILMKLTENFTGSMVSRYEKVTGIVLGSPGFVATNFRDYLDQVASKN